MSYTLRKSKDRGFFDHGGLKTYHTFSFAEYYDPKYMGFRSLRVINEDRLGPAEGFPPHAHKDMEILTLVLEGELAHKDSMESETVLYENEVQLMSAGSGVTHSEYNNLPHLETHFLQIWIQAETQNLPPSYEQKKVPLKHNQLTLIVSKDAREASLTIHQDVSIYLAHLDPGIEIEYQLKEKRYGWLQVISGDLSFEDLSLSAGDGLALEPKTHLKLRAKSTAKILFFDLN